LGTLDKIIEPVEDDLNKFSGVFHSLLKSRVGIINIITRHLTRQRGKRIRPVLVLLSARLCGSPMENTYKIAALIEMFHSATLIHDDIADDAEIRRGGPSIRAIWKNKVAVLIGDYILARSLSTAAELHNIQIIDILSNTSARMSQGEIDQMTKSKKRKINEEEYFNIIGDKTASLISASCELGAVSVDVSQEKTVLMKEFGEKIGLAFQIKDDLLDFEGEQKVFGKKKGTDLRDGKITLPLIYALQQVNRAHRNRILKYAKKNASQSDIRTVIHFIRDYGGMDYAFNKAKKLVDDARSMLDVFPDSEYKQSLIALNDFIVNRNK